MVFPNFFFLNSGADGDGDGGGDGGGDGDDRVHA